MSCCNRATEFGTIDKVEHEEDASLEEVVVTGSYLYSGGDSPSPVSVISGEDMVGFAPPDLQSFFFDNVPQNFSNDIGSQIENDGQSRARSDRNSTINLRGLGDENTLVVLNGRRVISYPSSDGTGWYRTAINSLVPRIATERTELLLDGGSAIFGSDAVAGVVNFVTRNDFRGFDMSLDSRMLEHAPDAKNVTLSALFGAGGDDTSIIAAIEFHQEDLVEVVEIDPVFQNFLANPDVIPSGILMPYLNNAEILLSDDAEIVERFVLSQDEERLDYRLIITDPATFTEPVTRGRHWLWRPGESIQLFECVE